jgi:recombination protein RecT
MNNLPPALQQSYQVIEAQRQTFDLTLSDEKIKFASEAQFAMQLLRGNDYLAKVAQRNPESLADAVKNVAAIGISLNPADKHAYLVPRDNKVCLDIGYLGLVHLATETGAVQWVQAKHVHANDEYFNNGVDKAPTHKFNSFGSRGNVVGVYCVAKTIGGDYLTTEMDIAEVNRIKGRSPSANKGFSPWKSDEGQMQLKTVIKRAYKQWPKSSRLSAAIDYMNNHGEGIDFEAERRTAQSKTGDLNPTPEQAQEIRDLLDAIGRDEQSFLGYLAVNILRTDHHIETISDLTGKEADQAIGLLKQTKSQIEAKQAKG